MSRVRTICCNVLLFLGCLPGYFRFRRGACNVRRCQRAKFLSLLRANAETHFGREHGFGRIGGWAGVDALPPSEYKDYRAAIRRIMDGETEILTRDPVRILQPTSGTSSAPKLIPYTESLAGEFRSALDAWIADLFMQRPRLILGPQYWSISPSTKLDAGQESKVPVGFLDDAEYFGRRRRRTMERIMAVPSEVGQLPDAEANQYVTLLFLLRARDLRLFSVWHPSFLTLLFDVLRALWPRLLTDLRHGGIDRRISMPSSLRLALEERLTPAPGRAGELERLIPVDNPPLQDVWPRLQVISCWCEGRVRADVAELQRAFPGVLIQGKGLMATEGVVSIPFGPAQQQVCAVTSHVLEFESDAGVVLPCWDVQVGQEYRVILSTGGGLYRYRLNDRVAVTGFYRQAPCLRFLGRAGGVSDCVGEKLHAEHVEEVVDDIARQHFASPRFAMLVPPGDGKEGRYAFLVESGGETDPDWQAVAVSLEAGLCRNYHYAYARALGQLQQVAVTPVGPGAAGRYRALMLEKGAVAGTIKFPALCTVPGLEAQLLGVPMGTCPRGETAGSGVDAQIT